MPAILIDNLSFAYPGGEPVLQGVSLAVEQGEMLAIVGPNGGGKTTLLRIILGLLGGYSGRVEVCGLPPREAQRRGLVGYVAQRQSAELAFPISARQAVAMGAWRMLSAWRREPREVHTLAAECLERVGATAFADEPVGRLSGGQLQRVVIARALASRPKILALDEPLTGVDAPGQKQFARLIRTLHRDLGLTILMVSHDLRAVATGVGGGGTGAGCDRVACLRRTLHFHAAPHGITPQVLAEVFQHDLADMFDLPDVHVHAHSAEECRRDGNGAKSEK